MYILLYSKAVWKLIYVQFLDKLNELTFSSAKISLWWTSTVLKMKWNNLISMQLQLKMKLRGKYEKSSSFEES